MTADVYPANGLTPYQTLRASRNATEPGGSSTTRRMKFTPAVARARNAERTRRSMEARRRALLILSQRYPDEFAALLVTERAGVDVERGPLPGDLTEDAP